MTLLQIRISSNFPLTGPGSVVLVASLPIYRLTVEFWNYYIPLPTTPNARYKYIYKVHPGNISGVEWGVGINNTLPSGGLFFYVNNQLLSQTGIYPNVHSWNHIAATFNNSTDSLKIYLNGYLVSSAVDDSANIENSTGNLYIGKDATNTTFILSIPPGITLISCDV